MLEKLGELVIKISDGIWGTPILILLLGGGLYFLIYSRLAPLDTLAMQSKFLRGNTTIQTNQVNFGIIRHFQLL